MSNPFEPPLRICRTCQEWAPTYCRLNGEYMTPEWIKRDQTAVLALCLKVARYPIKESDFRRGSDSCGEWA